MVCLLQDCLPRPAQNNHSTPSAHVLASLGDISGFSQPLPVECFFLHESILHSVKSVKIGDEDGAGSEPLNLNAKETSSAAGKRPNQRKLVQQITN